MNEFLLVLRLLAMPKNAAWFLSKRVWRILPVSVCPIDWSARSVQKQSRGFLKEEERLSSHLRWRSGYSMVPRKALMNVVKAKTTPEMAAMIGLTIQTMTQVTKNYQTSTTSICAKGMTQSGPLSPPLFNLNIDRYPYMLEEQYRRGEEIVDGENEWDVVMFPDDVKL